MCYSNWGISLNTQSLIANFDNSDLYPILKNWNEVYKGTIENKKKITMFPRGLLNAVRQVAKQKNM